MSRVGVWLSLAVVRSLTASLGWAFRGKLAANRAGCSGGMSSTFMFRLVRERNDSGKLCCRAFNGQPWAVLQACSSPSALPPARNCPRPSLKLLAPLTACSDAGRPPTVGGHVTWAGKLRGVLHACVRPTWAVVALPAIITTAVGTKLARGAVTLARCCVDQQGT